MYPTISHLIEDIFGVYVPLPIQTFGFCVAMAFIAAAYVIKLELERKEKQGLISSLKVDKIIGKKLSTSEIVISLITGFFIGFKFDKRCNVQRFFGTSPSCLNLLFIYPRPKGTIMAFVGVLLKIRKGVE